VARAESGVSRVVLVGSGASAVHFALSLLQKGHDVVMLDVGHERPAPVMPEATLTQLRDKLTNPVDYFLGRSFEAVLFPDQRTEYYGFPPSKTYIFTGVSPRFRWRASGFAPLSSFARGGLAEAWTAGVYPFNEAELADFPFTHAEIAPYYDLVAQRIGICGVVDDLARFMPVHQHLLPPLDLDEHSSLILRAYERRRASLNRRWGCYVGRSRIATISRDYGGRRACTYLGRCLWGCPSESLYTPSITLDECRRFDRFKYASGVYVRYFKTNARRRVTAVVVDAEPGQAGEEIPVDTLALGAGTLSSCRIFLESLFRETGQLVTLHGLMDNQQILMPFVNLEMLGRQHDPNTYQYHQIGLGLEGPTACEYIHGQLTTLKTAMIHPIVQKIPFDLRTSLFLFRNVHSALGLVNINLHDTRRSANSVVLEPTTAGADGSLLIHYEFGRQEEARVCQAMRRVRRVLHRLGCIVPPGMTHVRPMGASVHYSGLLPMTSTPGPWTTTDVGQSRDFENLFFIDGTTFPFLPAKNLTFTLMANAARIADRAF
jgi:choline dehydrogenase-like flavoprotein